MTFIGLIEHNLSTRAMRTVLTAAAVALAVMTVVTLGVVTDSLRNSATAVLEMGTADFSVAQKSAPDILNSVVTDAQVARLAKHAGVAGAVGVLVALTKLNADNPVFLEIGVAPSSLAEFGVHVVAGRPYTPRAANEVMLGWQAAQNLHLKVGGTISIDKKSEHVVGVYSTGQSFGDAGSMFPLVTLQAKERKPGTVTLAFVRVKRGASIAKVRSAIEADNPNLATVRLASEFGRVDRNLAFLSATDTGARIIALVIGVIIVMNTMLLSFIERIREFGLLRAVGWTRRRLLGLVLGEALTMSLLGAVVGVGLSFVFSLVLERLPTLRGVFHASFTPGDFWTALYTAIAIGVIAALYPGLRAARLRPLAALRKE